MRKTPLYFVLALLVAFVLNIFNFHETTQADIASPWLSNSIKRFSLGNINYDTDRPICNGTELPIKVKGNGTFNGSCVYGRQDSTRLAMYYGGAYYMYGVAPAFSDYFYELKGTCAKACYYSSDQDMLLTYKNISPYQYSGVLYKNFISKLTLKYDMLKASQYYEFSSQAVPDYELQLGSSRPSVNAENFSNNGKWAVFELKGYGIVVLNTTTLEARRVIAPGSSYGGGSPDPRYELAVSDNGHQVVTMGEYAPIKMVIVDEYCGDHLVQGLSNYFESNIIRCPEVALNLERFVTGYRYLARPRFDSSGNRLGFTAILNGTNPVRVIIGPEVTITHTAVDYIAMGDSYTSGEGEVDDNYYLPYTNESQVKCHVSSRSYPLLLGLSWGVNAKSVACSGATTDDIIGGNNYQGQHNSLLNIPISERSSYLAVSLDLFRQGVLPQISFIDTYQPKTVSVGIGGNDAGLVNKLTGCLNIGTCEWAEDPAKRFATYKEIEAVYPKIVNVIKTLKAGSPGSRILLVGYPQIINQNAGSGCGLVLGSLLSDSERQFIWETIHYINQIIKEAAQNEGVNFADIETSFTGNRLCNNGSQKAMNGIRFGDDIAPIPLTPNFHMFGAESFHPTPFGHNLVKDKIGAIFHTPNDVLPSSCLSTCLNSNNTSSHLLPINSDYWLDGKSESSDYVKQIGSKTISKIATEPGENLKIDIGDSLLKPGSQVKVELHSNQFELGEYTASSDGVLSADVEIPLNINYGYHVLHVYGKNTAEEPVDIYQTIYVKDNSQKNSSEAYVSITTNNTIKPSNPNTTIKQPNASSNHTAIINISDRGESQNSSLGVTPRASRIGPEVLGEASFPSNNKATQKQAVNISIVKYLLMVVFVATVILLVTYVTWRIKKNNSKNKGGSL